MDMNVEPSVLLSLPDARLLRVNGVRYVISAVTNQSRDVCFIFTYYLSYISPITIAHSMGQIIKLVCVCQCVSVSVRLRALSRSHFSIDFHQNHRRKNPQKEEQVR